MPSVEGIEDEVYNPLKWSYDSLQGNNTKSCFLYCSLFPKDFSIELVLHWRAEGLIDEQQNYVDSSPNSISELFVFLTVSCPNSWKWLKHFDILKPSYDWSSRPMSLVNVEDEGGHLWTMADVEGRRHMGKTAHVKGRRHMWATPMDTVDDKGHKLLEACFGNPIGGKGTFGAPNTRIVAQSTLDYWNNKGSIRVEVDMEELDLEEIDYERLKLKKIPFVLEELFSTMKDFKGKRALDLEVSIIWVDMEEVDLEEVDYEWLKQKISLVLKERIITMKDLKEQRARELRLEQDPEEYREKMETNTC
nr:putative disease resistance protein [Quercus suber]